MLSPTQLAARYLACTTTEERTRAAQVDPVVPTPGTAQIVKTAGGEPPLAATGSADLPLSLADVWPESTLEARLDAQIRPFSSKLAQIDVSSLPALDLGQVGQVLRPVAAAAADAESLKTGAELARIAQISTLLASDRQFACLRPLLGRKAAASSLFPLNRTNRKLRTPGIAIEEQIASGKPAKVGLTGSMANGGTGKLAPAGPANSPSANPINSYSGIGVKGQINGNAAFGTRNNSLTGAAKMGSVVSDYYDGDALLKAAAAIKATFRQQKPQYDPVCPHCGEVMYERHWAPDRENPRLARHRGDCYDKGAFELTWPDQEERDAETARFFANTGLDKPKQASGDMLAFKAWKATGLSDEEADRKAGESLALPGDKCQHCGGTNCRTDDTCDDCGKKFQGAWAPSTPLADGAGGYWAKDGERCQHCFALHERGDDGKCNSCGKEHDHPDYLAKKKAGTATPKIVHSHAKAAEYKPCPQCGGQMTGKAPNGDSYRGSIRCVDCQHTMAGRFHVKEAAVTGLTLDELREAAAECDPEPTDAQKASGNYRKGHIRWKGLPITIETAKGYTRSGKSGDGKTWSIKMRDHYGYIKQTESEADGDHVDVFLCEENLDSDLVFVVNQFVDGKFDEHKCMLGCENEEQARAAYLRNYSDGWDGLDSVKAMPIAEFKTWLAEGNTGKKADSSAEDMSLIPLSKAAELSPPIEVRLERLKKRRGETDEEFDAVTRDAMQHLERVLHVKFAGPSVVSPILQAQDVRLASGDPFQELLGAQHVSNFLNAGKNRATRALIPGALRAKRPVLNTPAGPPTPPALPVPQAPALIQ